MTPSSPPGPSTGTDQELATFAGLAEVAEDLPGAAAGPQVLLDDRPLRLGGEPDRAARRADGQPRQASSSGSGMPSEAARTQGAVLEQVDGEPLAAERGAERGQDQRQRRRRVGGDEPPGEPVQPGQLAARGGVHGLPGDERHHVVRVHLARRHLGDHPAVPQHDDPVGEPEHQLRVVAGQQDRGALLRAAG